MARGIIIIITLHALHVESGVLQLFLPPVSQDQIYAKNHGMDSVFTIGVTLFQEQVLGHSTIKNHLQQTLLNMIDQDRNGELVDR